MIARLEDLALTERPTRCLAPAASGRGLCRQPIPQSNDPRGRWRLTCCEACKKRRQRKMEREARKRSVEWYTPLEVFRWFADRWGPFDLDPFACPASPVWDQVVHRITRADDAFVTPWRGRRAFANPPYGRIPGIGRCLERGLHAVRVGWVELAAYLLPLRPSSAWCRAALAAGGELVPYDASRIRFLEPVDDEEDERGGLRQTSGALFECAALVFRDGRVSRNGTARVEPLIDPSLELAVPDDEAACSGPMVGAPLVHPTRGGGRPRLPGAAARLPGSGGLADADDILDASEIP